MKKKKIISLTNEDYKSHLNQKDSHIFKRKLEDKYVGDKKIKDHCHYTGKHKGVGHSMCNLKYKAPKKIPMVFHNGSNYDYHFIMKMLAKESEGEFSCLGENKEKYVALSLPKKNVRVLVKMEKNL